MHSPTRVLSVLGLVRLVILQVRVMLQQQTRGALPTTEILCSSSSLPPPRHCCRRAESGRGELMRMTLLNLDGTWFRRNAVDVRSKSERPDRQRSGIPPAFPSAKPVPFLSQSDSMAGRDARPLRRTPPHTAMVVVVGGASESGRWRRYPAPDKRHEQATDDASAHLRSL